MFDLYTTVPEEKMNQVPLGRIICWVFSGIRTGVLIDSDCITALVSGSSTNIVGPMAHPYVSPRKYLMFRIQSIFFGVSFSLQYFSEQISSGIFEPQTTHFAVLLHN